eukprot:scaffold1280_cov246-Pinguiococcus_pyrenoidosus.AAC.8
MSKARTWAKFLLVVSAPVLLCYSLTTPARHRRLLANEVPERLRPLYMSTLENDGAEESNLLTRVLDVARNAGVWPEHRGGQAGDDWGVLPARERPAGSAVWQRDGAPPGRDLSGREADDPQATQTCALVLSRWCVGLWHKALLPELRKAPQQCHPVHGGGLRLPNLSAGHGMGAGASWRSERERERERRMAARLTDGFLFSDPCQASSVALATKWARSREGRAALGDREVEAGRTNRALCRLHSMRREVTLSLSLSLSLSSSCHPGLIVCGHSSGGHITSLSTLWAAEDLARAENQTEGDLVTKHMIHASPSLHELSTVLPDAFVGVAGAARSHRSRDDVFGAPLIFALGASVFHRCV